MRSVYEEGAATYDAENAAAGFRMPQVCSAFFARDVPRGAAPILHAGCAAGAVGDILRIPGYRNLIGVDLSEAMLARAAETGAYSSLKRMALGERLDFADAAFAGAVISGVFTEGHAPPESFDELTGAVAPGGRLVFNVRQDVYENSGFRERQDALEQASRWRTVERSAPFRPFTIEEPDIRATIFVYEMLPPA